MSSDARLAEIYARTPGLSGDIELTMEEAAIIAGHPGAPVSVLTVRSWTVRGRSVQGRRGQQRRLVKLRTVARARAKVITLGDLRAFFEAVGGDAAAAQPAKRTGRVRDAAPSGLRLARPEEIGTYPPGWAGGSRGGRDTDAGRTVGGTERARRLSARRSRSG